MPNYIRVPLKDTTITTDAGPRHGIVDVSNVYDVTVSVDEVVGEHLVLHTSVAAGDTGIQTITIEYYANGGGTTVVTAQDAENFRDLILRTAARPGSTPIFNLIGEATAAAVDLEDYQVEQIGTGATTPT